MIAKLKAVITAVTVFATSGITVSAFNLTGAWRNGNIPLLLQLDVAGSTESLPSGGISDGSANWNTAVGPAIDAWNAHMIRSRLTSTVRTTLSATSGDNENSLFFSSDIFGEPFGDRVLAVTVSRRAGYSGIRHIESDIIFNSSESWDSYRGNVRSQARDVQRVALHEIGHLLGLLHPDEDTPRQTVPAIMNSTISNRFTLQPDDIEGITHLYHTPLNLPTITRHPQSHNVLVGQDVMLSVELNGAPAPPSSDLFQYAWIMDPPGEPEEYLFTIPDGNIPLGTVQLSDVGTYRVQVESPQGEVVSNTATIAVNPVEIATSTRLNSISTRGYGGAGDGPLIVGFTIGGTQTRRVLVRGIGPTLSSPPFNVTDAISDTYLELRSLHGDFIAGNNGWGTSPDPAELETAFLQSGAFALASNSRDSALIADLAPGLYTALLVVVAGTQGTALVEVYDLSSSSDEHNRFLSLSTRGLVGRNGSVLIAGISIVGPTPRTYVLRAAGDSLGGFGVSNFLDDPVISLFSGSTRLRWTDDWDSPAFLQPILQEAFTEVGAFPFVDRQESAMVVTLDPGLYTLVVSGFENSAGVALVEVYEMP